MCLAGVGEEVETVNAAIELLDDIIHEPLESSVDFYYAGVRSLLWNDKISARRRFVKALEKGCDDEQKVQQHLQNLENRRERF